jgi:hypothetical protein
MPGARSAPALTGGSSTGEPGAGGAGGRWQASGTTRAALAQPLRERLEIGIGAEFRRSSGGEQDKSMRAQAARAAAPH